MIVIGFPIKLLKRETGSFCTRNLEKIRKKFRKVEQQLISSTGVKIHQNGKLGFGPQLYCKLNLGGFFHPRVTLNKARHGDACCIAASPPFRSRACWLALWRFTYI